MSFFSEQIQQKNQALYNGFPYPGYPFYFRPHIPSAYPGASWFAKRLAGYSSDSTGSIAVLGCGDTQPYVMRQLEPSPSRLFCVDVAEKSLDLAKRKCWKHLSSMEFIHKDLVGYLSKQKNHSLSHIDAFGVLHHLSDPFEALFLMNQKLAPQATIRLMIYNSHARQWIKWVQKLTQLSGFKGDQKTSTKDFLYFIEKLVEYVPFLKTKLSSISIKSSQMPRLADAFLHVREIRRDITHWQHWWEEAGLRAVALFDRHAQMDHLENPMWKFIDAKILAKESEEGRVTSHWEIYLVSKDEKLNKQHQSFYQQHQKIALSGFYPKLWDEFDELSKLGYLQKIRLWHGYLANKHRFLPASTSALQRLARLGILLPAHCSDAIKQICLAPMSAVSEDSFETINEPLVVHQSSKLALDWWQQWINSRNVTSKTKAIELGQKIIIRLF